MVSDAGFQDFFSAPYAGGEMSAAGLRLRYFLPFFARVMDGAVFFVEAASGTFCLVLAFWFVPLSVFCGVGVGVCNLLFVLFGRWVFNVPLSLFGKNTESPAFQACS